MAKPAQWSWAANQVVDDGHRALAQAMTFLVPLWEGSGTPASLIAVLTASVASGSWETSAEGAINGPVWRTNASGERLVFAANSAFQLDGDIDFSFWITLVKIGTAGADRGFLSARTTFADGLWEFFGGFGTGNIQWFWHNGSLQQPPGDFGADVSAALHTLAGSRTASDDTFRVWADGTLRAAHADAAIPSATGGHQLNIGALGGDATTGNELADYALVAIWKGYALTQADVTLLQDGTAAGATHGFGLLEQQAALLTQTDYRFYNDDGDYLG